MSTYTLKNGKTLIIREAVEEDAGEIVRMSIQAGSESENLTFGYNDYYFNEEQERLFISTMNQRENSIFLVAIVDGRIIGNLSFITMQRKRLRHRGDMGIAVLKEYWGLGIGSAFMDDLMKWVKSNRDIKKIDLQVREDNVRAINLYLKWGFKVEGRISRGIYIDEEYFDIYYMGKTIE